jgi:hypothetical protein
MDEPSVGAVRLGGGLNTASLTLLRERLRQLCTELLYSISCEVMNSASLRGIGLWGVPPVVAQRQGQPWQLDAHGAAGPRVPCSMRCHCTDSIT